MHSSAGFIIITSAFRFSVHTTGRRALQPRSKLRRDGLYDENAGIERVGEPDCVLMVSHGLTSFRPPSEESGRCFLLARRAVVAFQKPIAATCEDIDLLQTTGLGAERSPITSEMFEVQYDPPRIFKVASKGTLGLR